MSTKKIYFILNNAADGNPGTGTESESLCQYGGAGESED